MTKEEMEEMLVIVEEFRDFVPGKSVPAGPAAGNTD